MDKYEMQVAAAAQNALANKKDFTTTVRESMTPEQLIQADKLNASVLELRKLTKELTDVRERVDIATAILKREERIWKDMISQTLEGE